MSLFKINLPRFGFIFGKKTPYEELPLRTNFAWTFVGNSVYAACQWGILAVIAKFTSPEKVGIFGLALAITGPLIIFSNLALRSVQATDARDEYHFNDYFGLRLVSSIFALLVIVAIALTLDYSNEMRFIILLVGIAKVLDAISDVIYGFFQKRERMDRIAISMMIKGPLSLVILFLGIFLTGDLLIGLLCWCIAFGLVLIFYDIPITASTLTNNKGTFLKRLLSSFRNLHAMKPSWDWIKLRSLVALALPLGISALLITLDTNIPRYFVERFLGTHELGLFVAMAYMIVVGRVIIAALGKSASPKLAKYYANQKDTAFRSLLFKLVIIGGAIGLVSIIVALFAGEEIMTILYTQEYANNIDVLVLLMIAGTLSYVNSFLGYGMTAARKFRIQPFIFAASITILVVGSIIFIPRFGLSGAAMALIVSTGFQVLCVLIVNMLAIRAIKAVSLTPQE